MTPADAYLLERSKRVVYSNVPLHASVIELLLMLLVTKHGTLEALYADVEPALNHRLNVLFLLQLHLNDPANEHMLPSVLDRIYRYTDQPALGRLMRLLCRRLFDPSEYELGERIGAGSYGQVFRAAVHSLPRPVAVKLTPVPQRAWDRCVLVDLFTEVTAMEMFASDRRICSLCVCVQFVGL